MLHSSLDYTWPFTPAVPTPGVYICVQTGLPQDKTRNATEHRAFHFAYASSIARERLYDISHERQEIQQLMIQTDDNVNYKNKSTWSVYS